MVLRMLSPSLEFRQAEYGTFSLDSSSAEYAMAAEDFVSQNRYVCTLPPC